MSEKIEFIDLKAQYASRKEVIYQQTAYEKII